MKSSENYPYVVFLLITKGFELGGPYFVIVQQWKIFIQQRLRHHDFHVHIKAWAWPKL